MNPGQLDQKGVANIAALGGVVQSQRVKYDFKYHQQDFDCDLVNNDYEFYSYYFYYYCDDDYSQL